MSFSGLKTAVVRCVEMHGEAAFADIAASFQRAIVDIDLEMSSCIKANATSAVSGRRWGCGQSMFAQSTEFIGG